MTRCHMSKASREAFRSLIYWTLAMVLFSFVRYFGVFEGPGIHVTFDFDPKIIKWAWLRYGLAMGLMLGVLDALLYAARDKLMHSRLPVGLVLAIESVASIAGIVTIFWLLFSQLSVEVGMDLVPRSGSSWLQNKHFVTATIYAGVASLFLSLIRLASNKFGRSVFFKLLIGAYSEPREENRIFMFLDLKGSTTIAEELGHYDYSRFIRDCLLDLDAVLLDHGAEVYQYVGDEAVLSWQHKRGVVEARCVALFFAFQDRLRARAEYYRTTYGHEPTFKAGVHGGRLIATEVGNIKKEIAYHGDVINTAARIQALCNKYDQRLIVSKTLFDAMPTENYTPHELGDLMLRGKSDRVGLIGLAPA